MSGNDLSALYDPKPELRRSDWEARYERENPSPEPRLREVQWKTKQLQNKLADFGRVWESDAQSKLSLMKDAGQTVPTPKESADGHGFVIALKHFGFGFLASFLYSLFFGRSVDTVVSVVIISILWVGSIIVGNIEAYLLAKEDKNRLTEEWKIARERCKGYIQKQFENAVGAERIAQKAYDRWQQEKEKNWGLELLEYTKRVEAWEERNKLQIADAKLYSSISEKLRYIDPVRFEHLISDLYSLKGYRTQWMGGVADGGVDVVAEKDGTMLLIQCKRYNESEIKVGVVRELLGVVHSFKRQYPTNELIPVLATTFPRFTLPATDFIRQNSIELISAANIASYIRETRLLHRNEKWGQFFTNGILVSDDEI